MKKIILEKDKDCNLFYGYDATDLEIKSIHDRAIVNDYGNERLIQVDGIIAIDDSVTNLPKALMMLSSKEWQNE